VIVVRAAKPFDALAVGAILGEFVDTTPWMPRIHTNAQDLAHAAALIESGVVTVVERDRSVVGFAACDGLWLNALYMRQGERRLGLGLKLLNKCRVSLREMRLWTFVANEGAQRFYLRHGFKEVRRTDGSCNDENLPDIEYHWQKEAAA